MKSRLSFTLRSRKVQLIWERGVKMAEYIEREAAEDAVGEAHLKGLNPLWELRDVPAADVVPVVHGKWIESANFDAGFWVCSKCRFVSEAIAAHKLYGYCPNCGAKMDGGTVDG